MILGSNNHVHNKKMIQLDEQPQITVPQKLETVWNLEASALDTDNNVYTRGIKNRSSDS